MNTPKYNKFNTGKTAGYFPFKRWRFNTESHPIIQSKEKCASSTTKTKFSTQELQMLVGLTNSLQCKEREAIRIALYEASKSSFTAYESSFAYATSTTTQKAHQGRLLVKQWKLPKSEKNQAVQTANELGITEQEFIRLAIIWLQTGIRADNNSIKKLTNSKLISFDTEATKWSRENQGKPASPEVAKLKKARDIAYQEAGEIYKSRNQAKWAKRKAYLIKNGFSVPPDENGILHAQSLDALIEIQEADILERIVQEEIEKLRLNERESFDCRWKELIPELTTKDLDFMWQQELTDAKELSCDNDTLEKLYQEVDEFVSELNSILYTPEERKEQQRQAAKFDKDYSNRIRSKIRWHEMSIFEQRLKKRLDNLFDGKG